MILEQQIKEFVINALKEDVGDGDHTSLATIPKGTQGKAHLLIKDNGVLAGVEMAKHIFNIVDNSLQLEIFKKDGDLVKVGDIVLVVSGNVHSILIAERLVLNTMQRMSGIATITARVVKSLEGTNCKVLDTRKTTPNLRFLEKWAVRIGGGTNHRGGLYDMILIKDNHIDYAGGINNAIINTKEYLSKNGLNLPIEVETRNLDEVKQVLEFGGITRIMFDNFSFENLREAVRIVNGVFPTESSGGITFENARQYAECGVDYISMGAITHSVRSLDMSLKAIK
jgi:nicotinate-nucleotide pyrophosphorylase (carboxylating)